MGLSLNQISDAGVQNLLEDALEDVEDIESGSTFDKAWESYFELALCQYQQELADADIARNLSKSGEVGIGFLEERPSHTEGDRKRKPYDFGLIMGAAVAFGTKDLRSRLGAIQVDKWYGPADPFLEVGADTYEAFRKFVAAGERDEQLIDGIKERLGRDTATRQEIGDYTGIIDAMDALRDADSAKLQAAIDQLIDAHTYDAKRGELKMLAKGFMAILPLALIRLGREAGLEVDSDSIYAPTRLLEDVT